MAMKKRIFIVEDDRALARVLSDNLAFCGFEVEWAPDGNVALSRLQAFSPDLVLLDVMLPGHNGFDLCGLMRQRGRTPIIILTALNEKTDKLRGLDMGADDYITKPFDFDELRARVNAVLRRARPTVDSLTLGTVIVDFRLLRAMDGERDIHLTHREFDVLHYLAERQGRVVLRSELLREVWGYPEKPRTRSVDYAIVRLRKKVEPDPYHPRYVHTVHGDGYCLTTNDDSSIRLAPKT
jgi:DNA-binding response OmpR family regulator